VSEEMIDNILAAAKLIGYQNIKARFSRKRALIMCAISSWAYVINTLCPRDF
jgi:hypothetical protein